MTTFKMPEPAAARWPTVPGSHGYCGCKGCSDLGGGMELLYTAEALRDVLEQAAELVQEMKDGWGDVAEESGMYQSIELIRAMKEQIK